MCWLALMYCYLYTACRDIKALNLLLGLCESATEDEQQQLARDGLSGLSVWSLRASTASCQTLGVHHWVAWPVQQTGLAMEPPATCLRRRFIRRMNLPRTTQRWMFMVLASHIWS